MSILASIHHLTHYIYDRPVSLQPQVILLRPVPLARVRRLHKNAPQTKCHSCARRLQTTCARRTAIYCSSMDSLLETFFDPASAISASSVSKRVRSTVDQHHLDIVSKERNSVLPWKGQFSPQLVEFLLSRHATQESVILDPFCGSGTLLH
jgi:late competence protein required for DNA uptake (superfamily II DNA/RNA helicase)